MSCDRVLESDISEKYVLGELSDAERDAFEEHYLVCTECFEHVQMLTTVRAQLSGRRERPGRGPRRVWVWGAIAAAVLVVVVGAAGYRLSHERAAPVESRAQPDRTTLAVLARVDPAPYAATPLRGGSSAPAQDFRRAMQLYVRADYRNAATVLASYSRREPEKPAPHFYLGVCDLLLGREEDGIAELRRVEQLPESAYTEEAHLDLAKAYLAKADFPDAWRELEQVARANGSFAGEAHKLQAEIAHLTPHAQAQ